MHVVSAGGRIGGRLESNLRRYAGVSSYTICGDLQNNSKGIDLTFPQNDSTQTINLGNRWYTEKSNNLWLCFR